MQPRLRCARAAGPDPGTRDPQPGATRGEAPGVAVTMRRRHHPYPPTDAIVKSAGPRIIQAWRSPEEIAHASRVMARVGLSLVVALGRGRPARSRGRWGSSTRCRCRSIQEPQLSPDGRQVLFVMDGARLEGQPARRPRLPDQRGRHGPGAADLRRARRDRARDGRRTARSVAFLARRDRRRAEPDLPAAHRRRRGAAAHRARRRRPAVDHLGAGRVARSTSWRRTRRPPRSRRRDRLQDDVYAFEETNFKQRHLWSVGPGGHDDEDHRGRLLGRRSTRSHRTGSRIVMSRTPSPLLEFSHLTEVWVMDADAAPTRAS